MGVSVNSAPGASIEALPVPIANRQIGVTTVGAIRRAGGNFAPALSPNNCFHRLLGGITPEETARLFAPVAANPNR